MADAHAEKLAMLIEASVHSDGWNRPPTLLTIRGKLYNPLIIAVELPTDMSPQEALSMVPPLVKCSAVAFTSEAWALAPDQERIEALHGYYREQGVPEDQIKGTVEEFLNEEFGREGAVSNHPDAKQLRTVVLIARDGTEVGVSRYRHDDKPEVTYSASPGDPHDELGGAIPKLLRRMMSR